MPATKVIQVSSSCRLPFYRCTFHEKKVPHNFNGDEKMLTSFLLCRFEISIKDLTITRVSRSKEEINKSNCVIKMLLGNQVLEFENVHLENCFNGVTLLDSMNTSESFVELNNPFTLLLEAEEVNHYAFFLSFLLSFFSSFCSLSFLVSYFFRLCRPPLLQC